MNKEIEFTDEEKTAILAVVDTYGGNVERAITACRDMMGRGMLAIRKVPHRITIQRWIVDDPGDVYSQMHQSQKRDLAQLWYEVASRCLMDVRKALYNKELDDKQLPSTASTASQRYLELTDSKTVKPNAPVNIEIVQHKEELHVTKE